MMFGGIGMLLFWGVVIVVLVLAGRALIGGRVQQPPSETSRSGSTALEILRERFAKGEITREEYEETKKTLME
jgi:putative membrane protein